MKDGKETTLKTILNTEISIRDLNPFRKKSNQQYKTDGLKNQFISSKPALKIRPQEISDFVLMSESGLSFRDCAVLSFKHHEQILYELENGKNLKDILTDKQKGRFFERLRDLLGFCSLRDALNGVLHLEKGSSKLFRTLAAQACYPLFLMFFSWILLWFFTLEILPALSVYAEDSDFLLLYILLGAFTLIWAVILIAALLLGLSSKGKGCFKTISSSLLIKAAFRFALFQKIQGYSLAAILEFLLSSGLSGRKALILLSEMKAAGLISLHAKNWMAKMEKGSRLEECLKEDRMIDPVFLTFLQVGMESGKTALLLKNYQKQTLIQIEKSIKKISLWIQCLSYGCVGALCISVYQVMLAPLNMLNTL